MAIRSGTKLNFNVLQYKINEEKKKRRHLMNEEANNSVTTDVMG